MESVVLKKSCDACTTSKVRCSGGNPCARCIAKGCACYYSPRKRRAKPKKKKGNTVSSEDDLGMNDFAMKPPSQDSLVEWEKRSWSVFFTLYKHYGSSCSLFWFNRQLKKMEAYLRKQGNKSTLNRLTQWMKALNIDVDAITAQIERCRVKCFVMKNSLPMKVEGYVEESPVLISENIEERTRIPYIKVIYTDPFGTFKPENELFKVTCNRAFSQVFGLEKSMLEEQLKWTAGGFLPFGGDLLARILTKEKDLLAFVQILAIKFNTMQPPTQLPSTRDIPSCHMFEANVLQSLGSSKTVVSNVLVKCLHREILTKEECRMEITFEITPVSPYEHLLAKRPLDIGSEIELNELVDLSLVKPCALSISDKIQPYSNERKKRQRNPSYDENVDDIWYGSNPTATPPPLRSDEIQINDDQVVNDDLVGFDNVFDDEADNWLDGLLTWANDKVAAPVSTQHSNSTSTNLH